jgi:hypothetical protein
MMFWAGKQYLLVVGTIKDFDGYLAFLEPSFELEGRL